MIPSENISLLVKKKALDMGFDACGISKVIYLADPAKKLQQWLDNGYHAGMKYMENHFEKRVDPGKLVDGAKSVISVILNYFPKEKQPASVYRISKYAYGEDYHFVLKRKLKELLNYIKQLVPDADGRCFVDSAPVLDREWARQAGIGWIGKHSLLINKESGSFIFIGELIVNIELEYDKPIEDYCGSCTRCIDSCPTGAIVVPQVIDSNKCISYHTIENKGNIPVELTGKFQNYIFGCDICQDVCPWNNKKIFTKESAFKPDNYIFSFQPSGSKVLSENEFNEVFKKSPLKRAGYKGLLKNIAFLKSKTTD